MLHKARRTAIKYGYRSGLEVNLSKYLDELNYKYGYESIKIEWEDLAYRTYTPDFVLPNGIIVEAKGYFESADRTKHLLVQAQHPELDIRFVFQNSRNKLTKNSSTTYADWCIKNGFQYADMNIPKEWINEIPKPKK